MPTEKYFLDVEGTQTLIQKTVEYDIIPYAQITVTYTSDATDLDGADGKYKISSTTNYYNTNKTNPATGAALTSSLAWSAESNVSTFIKRITKSRVRLIFSSTGWNALAGGNVSSTVGVDLQYEGQTGSTVKYVSPEIGTSDGGVYFVLTGTMTSSSMTWGTLKVHGHKPIATSYINSQLT